MYSSRFYNIDQIIKDYSKQKSDTICLIFENLDTNLSEQLTYKEFDNYISKASNYLKSKNISAESKILISIPNSLVFLIFLFACFRTGIVCVTVNPNLTDRELAYQYKKSDSIFLISISDKSNITSSNLVINSDSLSYLDNLLSEQSTIYSGNLVAPDMEATILFTSGTTNLPKGVISTNYSYLNKISNVSKHLKMTDKDRHYLTLPIFHTNGQYSLLAVLSVGGSAVITSRFSTSKYFEIAKKFDVTLSTLFASTIRMLLLSKNTLFDKNNKLRLIMFAQSVSEAELIQWDKKIGINLIQIYGMSETTGMISANPLNQSKNMSMGKILPLYKYKILNFDGQTSKTYENGELLIQGESGITFMKGYINDSKSTNSTIVNNFLHTGDIVYEDDEGYIFFVDRVNDVIKRSGENISTIEIENIIINHPNVRDVSVVGIPDKIMDYKIIAYIILNNTNIDLNNLKDFCKMNLVSYKVPEQFIIVDKFPTTPVGKIQKYKLKKEQQ